MMWARRGALTALLLVLVPALPPKVQAQEGPILEVRLVGVGDVVVRAEGTMDAPHLPTAEVFALVGLDGPSELPAYAPLDALAEALGSGVQVDYFPHRALVEIRDPAEQLPATRERTDRARAESAARPSTYAPTTGPFGSAVSDTRGARRLALGWNFGPVELAGSTTTEGGERWRASVRPADRLFLTYRDGTGREPTYDARLALGRTFATLSYRQQQEELDARIASAVGPFSFSVTGRDIVTTEDVGERVSAVVTWRGDVVDVTVARAPQDRWIGRISFGARRHAPLTVPRVR